ncbi:MAG: hypothetical protein ACSW77_04465, partial [Bacteroidales bacterium]
MKVRSFLWMMVATVAIALSLSACGSSDKDEPEVALASQVAGSYTGNEIIVVSGEESSNGTATYTFTK